MKFESVESIANKITHPRFDRKVFIEQCKNKDFLIHQLAYSKYHEEGYNSLRLSRTSNLADVVPDSPIDLRVNDLVTFVNDYGVAYVNNKVLGFSLDQSYGLVVYLDYDCYWVPCRLSSLFLQDGYVGVDEADFALVEERFKNSSVPYDIEVNRRNKAAEES